MVAVAVWLRLLYGRGRDRRTVRGGLVARTTFYVRSAKLPFVYWRWVGDRLNAPEIGCIRRAKREKMNRKTIEPTTTTRIAQAKRSCNTTARVR